MLISNVHRSMIVMNSLDARFSKNFFEAVQKTRRLRLVVLNPIKPSSSFFKHYLVWRLYHVIAQLQRFHYLRTAAGHKAKTKIASPKQEKYFLSFR